MQFQRLELLIGEDAVKKLKASSVFICGVGGVGSWAAEMLARSGVGRIVMMDMDAVKPSNLNRQLPALHSTLGRLKVDVLAERLKDINPDAEIVTIARRLNPEDAEPLLREYGFDCVLDAIDERPPKIALINSCVQLGIPIVSSMGAGNKRSPELVKAVDISQTYGCPLAKQIRKSLRKLGIEKGVQVVFSPELPAEGAIAAEPDESGEKRPVGTIAYMPAIFGMHCSSAVIAKLIK